MFDLRTSSTSVEQARERGYHRALLLSKDKDTGEIKEAHALILEMDGFHVHHSYSCCSLVFL